MLENVRVSPGPHVSKHISTRKVMGDVIIGLLPAMLAACYFFRLDAIRLIAACMAGCLASELIFNLFRKKGTSLDDLSAVVTGIILALSLPPNFPWWAAVIGSAFCIIFGKMVFGGLGSNVFNPAMVGRAFLAACFGTLMTTFTVPATINPGMPTLNPTPVLTRTAISDEQTVAVVSQATPLKWVKDALKEEVPAVEIYEKQLKAMVLGETAGSLGETSIVALLIGGIYLLIRRTITFHIPLAVIAGAMVYAAIGYYMNSEQFAHPLTHLVAGSLVFCAFFIATDPVTAPLTIKGQLLFGFGIGLLIMLIRTAGAYPEGVMYAVLLMNSLAPLIDRMFRIVPVGGSRNA